MEDEEQKKRGLVRCQCEWCGRIFWADRSSATFCVPSHKQKMYRWRKRIETQTAKIIAAVDDLARYLKIEKTTPSAVSALQEIRARVLTVLLDNNVRTVK
jgi:hypothetical protein